MRMTRYAELQVTSNFSFLRGASHPSELVEQAKALGHAAIAITDRNSLAGIVRGHVAAEEQGLRFVVGCRLELEDLPRSNVRVLRPSSPSLPPWGGEGRGEVGQTSKIPPPHLTSPPPGAERNKKGTTIKGQSLLCFPTSRAAYGRLTRLLTRGKRRAEKAQCQIFYDDLLEFGDGQLLVALPPEKLTAGFAEFLRRLAADFPGRAYLAAQHLYRGDDARRLHRLKALADETGLKLVATNDVLYHAPERRPLQDVVSCIREGCTLAEAGSRLNGNAERHLKTPDEMARLFRGYEDALERTLEIVERCKFSLNELKYDYPDESGGDGSKPQARLESLTWNGAAWRYPDGVPDKVRDQIEKELTLIEKRDYAPYFLTVNSIMKEAKRREILCQGRGSAANSVVCYCLGVTSVDPTKIDLLFDRFINDERHEPPDIDVDFEHERREEIIQHIYNKYGRDKAALTATVIHYRPRRAVREVGKVLGLSEDVTAALAGTIWGWYGDTIEMKHVRELGLDPADPTLCLALELTRALVGFPRHLSQHVGGFVITRGPLEELVPIENASMADRTVIEWDKDDIDALRILKIDILALGMLTAIRRGFDLIERHYGKRYTMATIPAEDPAVYEMLQRADSIGVFQVESRAQMSMLPRLKPEKFYDLVVEVAIVRPGPIQGGMVHPYLRRRNKEEPVEYPSKALEEVLGKTLGVPLFQEQAMKIAIVAAGFSGAEADGLRHAMATFRHNGHMPKYKDKFIKGMIDNGYKPDFTQRCFSQIEGFGEYGFPESHAASFALLVYASAWIKCFYPEVFAAALLNSQPMGFYGTAQLVRDAREHGVELREADVNLSDWDCSLEPIARNLDFSQPSPAWRDRIIFQDQSVVKRCSVRLGFNQIKGLAKGRLEEAIKSRGPGYISVHDFARRSGLDRKSLERLAEADAFRSLGLDRRQVLWAMKGIETPPLFAAAETPAREAPAPLPEMPLGQQVIEDYAAIGLSLKSHPLALLRDALRRRRILSVAELRRQRDGGSVTVAGLVLVRQRPGKGNVVFMTLEDETGIANLVLWIPVFERFRRIAMGARMVACTGKLQRQGEAPHEVIHVVAERLVDLSPLLLQLRESRAPGQPSLALQSHDFR
jgi:error-prone DNA polymerase